MFCLSRRHGPYSGLLHIMVEDDFKKRDDTSIGNFKIIMGIQEARDHHGHGEDKDSGTTGSSGDGGLFPIMGAEEDFLSMGAAPAVCSTFDGGSTSEHQGTTGEDNHGSIMEEDEQQETKELKRQETIYHPLGGEHHHFLWSADAFLFDWSSEEGAGQDHHGSTEQEDEQETKQEFKGGKTRS